MRPASRVFVPLKKKKSEEKGFLAKNRMALSLTFEKRASATSTSKHHAHT